MIAALSHRVFFWIWAGSLVSNVGTLMESTSQSWLVFDKSQSAAWTGALLFAALIPMAILALPMGVVADRYNRRKLLLLFQCLMCCGATLQAVACHLGWTEPWMTVSIALLEGICAGAVGPVWHSLVPELVPREDLGGAIALNSAQFNVARSVGPMLAGVVISWWSMAVAFDLNVASFLLVIAALFFVRTNEAPRKLDGRRWTAELFFGLKAVRAHPGMFRLIWTVSVYFFFSGPIFALLPALAERHLAGEVGTYSSLMSALGFGAVFGAFFMTRLAAAFSRQATMTTSGVLTAVCLAGLAFTHSRNTALGLFFGFGIGWCVYLTTQNTALQLLTPDAIRGKVMSVNVLAFVAAPIGHLHFGWLAEQIGLSATLGVLCGGTLLVSLVHLALPVREVEEQTALAEAEPLLVEA